MARKYIKKITETEFNQYLKLRDGYKDCNSGQASWANISAQEQARYERDYLALEIKLYHTLGFKESEDRLIPYLKQAQEKFELLQELALNEDAQLKEAIKAESKAEIQKTKKEFTNFIHEHPEFVEDTKNRKTVFSEAFDELNKIK